MMIYLVSLHVCKNLKTIDLHLTICYRCVRKIMFRQRCNFCIKKVV